MILLEKVGQALGQEVEQCEKKDSKRISLSSNLDLDTNQKKLY